MNEQTKIVPDQERQGLQHAPSPQPPPRGYPLGGGWGEGSRWGANTSLHNACSRRTMVAAGMATAATLLFSPFERENRILALRQDLSPQLTIDLAVEPATLDPALVYEADGWSVIHSIYDALVQLGPEGTLEMVLAEAMTQIEPLIWEITLRSGITFHNGEQFDARSVAFSVAHITAPETKSQIAGSFQVITEVEQVDPLTVRLHTAAPAPWLPSQMAPWLAMLPPDYASDPANEFATNPVGTGPYRFVRWDRGAQITLARNETYAPSVAKGEAIADDVTFRFVADATTRVTDVISGTSQLVRGVPYDQLAAVEDAAAVVAQPIAGCAFVRIPNDVAPFDDPRVRLAMNHAVDVDAIVASLLGENGTRLPNVFVPGGLGFDERLAPHAYDPELAKQLLAEAGYPDGFQTRLAHTIAERADLVAAVAGQLSAVGIVAALEPVETATFNQTWTDPEAAPLRFLTWRPLFDPYTLLSLLFASTGFLSRYNDPDAQALIEAGASETDPVERNRIYQQLGRVLHDAPAAIYLWSLTSFYGVDRDAPPWTPRPDDWILPLAVGE